MRVLLCGGGTGGHIYPALALARHIKKKEKQAEVLFVGAERGLETRLVPEAGFKLETIPVRSYEKKIKELIPAGWDLSRSSSRVNRILWKFRPHVVAGTGGYASGPVVLWSRLRGYPAVIHEQNAIPGKTNRLLAPLVNYVCLSYENSGQYFGGRVKTILTGNPRGSEVKFYAREEGLNTWGLSPQKKTLIVFGGSQGAQKINEIMVESLKQKLLPQGAQVLYVTGDRYYEEVARELENIKVEGVITVPYIKDMPAALAAADLVVSRAGATALAEINARGVPSLLIPSPNVVHNHQYYNARVLEEKGAARIILEKDFSAHLFSSQVKFLLENENKLEEMKVKSKELGMPEAAERMFDCMKQIIKNSIL